MGELRTGGDSNTRTQILLKDIHNLLMYKFGTAPYIYSVSAGGIDYSYLCWCNKNDAAYTDQVWLVLQYATTVATKEVTAKWSSPSKAFDKILDNGAGKIATITAFTYYNSGSINY